MGSRNLKTIKGKKYLYYVVSENGKKRAIYCGPAFNPKSKKKALQLELEQMRKQKVSISKKISGLESKIKSII